MFEQWVSDSYDFPSCFTILPTHTAIMRVYVVEQTSKI
jgi:hypothetical protein